MAALDPVDDEGLVADDVAVPVLAGGEPRGLVDVEPAALRRVRARSMSRTRRAMVSPIRVPNVNRLMLERLDALVATNPA